MMARSTISIPHVTREGSRPLFRRSRKIEISAIEQGFSKVIEAMGAGTLDETHHALLRSCLYAHYHPELRVGPRVRIYQAVKDALEDSNLNQLRDIMGIKRRSAYINAISNVGKRSSYFGGLIGVTVAGHFFLPPFVKLGILPAARSAIRRLVPRQSHLTPIDKPLRLSSLIGRSPTRIYAGIRRALGYAVTRAGKPVSPDIDTTPMDDLIGNLFFRSLIEVSSFTETAREGFRSRAQIAFLYDMARVSRQLEGLARNPDLCWERISHYTNFSMFLKSMESPEVPIQAMLQEAVEIISRAKVGGGGKEIRFYVEFERGLKYLNYLLQVVEPLDRFNEEDAFDDLDSQAAKLAFFEQNRLVMERLYLGHQEEVSRLLPMFLSFKKAALEIPLKGTARPGDRDYQAFQARVRSIITSNKAGFRELGTAELKSYDAELRRAGCR